MIKRIILGQLRHIMGAGGAGFTTWLIENGASASDAEVIVSGIISAVGFAWSFWDKYSSEKSNVKGTNT